MAAPAAAQSGEAIGVGAGEAAARPAQSFDSAFEQVSKDKALQFDFPDVPAEKAAPPPPQPDPAWTGLGEFLGALAPVMQIVFWGGIALIVGLILFYIGREILRLNYARKPKPKAEVTVPEWRPDEKTARTLLAEADRLAAEGRFAEAVLALLIRSIEDFDSRRPHTVRRAYTSREIASLDALPESARPAFVKIAQVVERSLFGGASVDREAFADCREAYEAFALPTSWAR